MPIPCPYSRFFGSPSLETSTAPILEEILCSGTLHLGPDPWRIDLPPYDHGDATFVLGSVELREGSLIE